MKLRIGTIVFLINLSGLAHAQDHINVRVNCSILDGANLTRLSKIQRLDTVPSTPEGSGQYIGFLVMDNAPNFKMNITLLARVQDRKSIAIRYINTAIDRKVAPLGNVARHYTYTRQELYDGENIYLSLNGKYGILGTPGIKDVTGSCAFYYFLSDQN